ncbi:MAG TPA: hypothetical protein VGB17_13115 [Pyrinomonadaceae bacterium]
MPGPTGKKRKRASKPKDATASQRLNPLRAGMPAQDSIEGVKQMERDGKVYRIIKTNETDAYEQPAKQKRSRKRSD